MPEAEDWVALDAEITSKKKKLADIDNQIADKSKQIEAVFDKNGDPEQYQRKEAEKN